MPEASVPSRFLEEVPATLLDDLGSPGKRHIAAVADNEERYSPGDDHDFGTPHYAYEEEDQSRVVRARTQAARRPSSSQSYAGPTYNSIENIAEFFASRGKKFSRPKMEAEATGGKRGFRPGQRVRHPKYGEGTVFKREGDGDDAKITVQFPRFGVKKLVEKYAQLESC